MLRQPYLSIRRLLIISTLFVALSYLGFYAVYDLLAGRNLTVDSRLLAWPFVLSVLALLCIYYIADGLRLYYTLRALNQPIALRRIFPLIFINLFFANITPLATGGGFAQVWYLHAHGVRIGTATAATTIRTMLAMLFIFTLAPACLLALDTLDGTPLLADITVIVITLLGCYVIFFMILLTRTAWLILPLSALLRWLRRSGLIGDRRHRHWQYKCRREILQLAGGFTDYLRGRRCDIVLSIFFTAVFLVSLFSFPALLIGGLGYEVSYLMTLGLTAVTTFIMYFSPTPGAAGISEGVFGTFFSGILSPDHLLLVTLCWRFLTIYLGMLVGLVIVQLLLVRKRHQK